MTDSTPTHPPLSTVLPDIILGGAGFSNQLHPDPHALPALSFIRRAHALGIRALDTSPYYGESETILGNALRDAGTAGIPREDFLILTKAGRIAADRFDYSADAIRASVERSLQRFHTSYLDLVFCHDAEYVDAEAVVEAVGALWDLQREGKMRYVGISGYAIPTLVALAKRVQDVYGRPLDAVQVWAQLTVQNGRLASEGIRGFAEEAGVDAVLASSPLGVGLLRDGGVPVGALGDWHPAPAGLREKCQEAAEWVKSQGEGMSLAEVALRYAVDKARRLRDRDGVCVVTIIGAGNVPELEENAKVCMDVLERRRKGQSGVDTQLVEGIRNILGDWVDYSLES